VSTASEAPGARPTTRPAGTTHPHGNKVKVGFFSFTEITDPGAHRAYNEWHQLDHLPEQYTIPGIAHGQRWVATPACRAARAAVGDRLEPTHYVTLYLMGPPVEETLAAFGALAKTLWAADRFFEPRRALVSGAFAITGRAAAARALVAADVVPVRPNRGVYVVVEEGTGAPAAGTLEALAALPGVAGAWAFAASPDLAALGWDPGEFRVTVAWLDEPPLSVAPAVEGLLGADGVFGGPLAYAGPLETITPWEWGWFDE